MNAQMKARLQMDRLYRPLREHYAALVEAQLVFAGSRVAGTGTAVGSKLAPELAPHKREA